jgi:hypothetical protein
MSYKKRHPTFQLSHPVPNLVKGVHCTVRFPALVNINKLVSDDIKGDEI